MRNIRKSEDGKGSKRSIMILGLLLVLLIAVIFTMNLFQARDHVNALIGIGGTNKEITSVKESETLQVKVVQEQQVDTSEVALSSSQSNESQLSKAISPLVENNQAHFKSIKPIVITMNQAFSYQEWMKTIELDLEPNDHSILASLLFESALKAGLTVGERFPHLKIPAYVNPGYDVEVTEVEKDLRIYNPYAFDVSALITLENGKVVVSIRGAADEKWQAQTLKVVSEQFAAEHVQVVDFSGVEPDQQGKPGLLVKVYSGSELLHKDFYAPNPQITHRKPTAEEKELEQHSGKLQSK